MLRVAEGHPLINAAAMLNPKSKIRNNLLGNNGAKAQQRQLARLSMGAVTMGMMHEMALNGRITGSYPSDKQLQRMLPPGWQPYSFVFRGEGFPVDEDGDPLPLYNPETGLPNGPLTYISYQGLEPVSAFVGIAASTAQHPDYVRGSRGQTELFQRLYCGDCRVFQRSAYAAGHRQHHARVPVRRSDNHHRRFLGRHDSCVPHAVQLGGPQHRSAEQYREAQCRNAVSVLYGRRRSEAV